MPSTGLSKSLAALAAGQAGLSLSDEMKIDRMAMADARTLSLAEKARAEAEATRNREADMRDPDLNTESAAYAAGVTSPVARQFQRYTRAEKDPNPQGVTDPVDNVYGEVAVARPELQPEQGRALRAALRASILNRTATGDSNAAQVAAAAQTGLEDILSGEAAELEPTEANRLLAAAARKTREPFGQGGHGQVLNQETGDVSSTPVSEAELRRIGAAARASDARARASANPRSRTSSPYQVRRWIDLTAEKELKVLQSQWEALSFKDRKTTPRPKLEDVRAEVEKRYQKVGAASQPSPYAEYPDAKFDPDLGLWVVTKGGKRFAVEDDEDDEEE